MKNRLVHSLAIALAVPLLLTAVAGCSAGSSASDGSNGSTGSTRSGTGSSAKGTAYDWDIAEAKCIRAQGVTDYPDPQPDGARETTADGYPGLHDAVEKCGPVVTKSLGPRPVADYEKPDPQYEDTMRRIFACLNKEGYDLSPGENPKSVSDATWKKCDADGDIAHE